MTPKIRFKTASGKTLETQLASLKRYIVKQSERADDWEIPKGSHPARTPREAFDDWARTTVVGFLKNQAQCVYVVSK